MLQQESIDKLDSFFSQYKILNYKSRSVISSSNDSGLSIFYIKSGFLRVYRPSGQGEELTLTILKPKDFFPLNIGLYNIRHTGHYYLEALTPLEIWKVNLKRFNQFIKREPALYLALTNKAFFGFSDVLSKMENLLLNNASIKIAATLISCARNYGKNEGKHILINVPLTHRDIAALVGITRETTSLEIKKLEKQGYLEKKGKYLLIKNIENLNKQINLIADNNSSI